MRTEPIISKETIPNKYLIIDQYDIRSQILSIHFLKKICTWNNSFRSYSLICYNSRQTAENLFQQNLK